MEFAAFYKNGTHGIDNTPKEFERTFIGDVKRTCMHDYTLFRMGPHPHKCLMYGTKELLIKLAPLEDEKMRTKLINGIMNKEHRSTVRIRKWCIDHYRCRTSNITLVTESIHHLATLINGDSMVVTEHRLNEGKALETLYEMLRRYYNDTNSHYEGTAHDMYPR